MNPFAVTWSRPALAALADVWLQARDRNAITQAQARVDRRLARDPLGEGFYVAEELYRLDEAPLVVHYSVDLVARSVEVLLVQ